MQARACGRLTWVACNFTHRWTDNENFSACGAGEPAAQVKEIVRGKAREKKSPDLARGFEMKEKVKEIKNIDICILKCLQRFVIAS